MSQLLRVHIFNQLCYKVAPTFGKLLVSPAIGDQPVQQGSSTEEIKVAENFVDFRKFFLSKAYQEVDVVVKKSSLPSS